MAVFQEDHGKVKKKKELKGRWRKKKQTAMRLTRNGMYVEKKGTQQAPAGPGEGTYCRKDRTSCQELKGPSIGKAS